MKTIISRYILVKLIKFEGKHYLTVHAEKKKKTYKLFWMDSMDLDVPQVSLRPEDKIKDGTSKESVIQWAVYRQFGVLNFKYISKYFKVCNILGTNTPMCFPSEKLPGDGI